MTAFYCLRFETPPIWRARSPYLYPPETKWPRYIPRHWVPVVIIQKYLNSSIETGVCLSAYFIATAVLVVLFEVSAQQRVYTPQYFSESPLDNLTL
jgi:hypothetical protein